MGRPTGTSEMLLAGTPEGIYRVPQRPFDSVERVFTGSVRQLHTNEAVDGVLAGTDTGVVRTTDNGDSWDDLDVPVKDVHSVVATEECIYAGVRPAEIYRSDDGGNTWTTLSGFRDAACAASWPTTPHRDHAQVRSLASPPTEPDLLVAGVEVGGLVVSTDGGVSWRDCPAVPDDVHHVLCHSAEQWIVSCGTGGPDGRGGVYRTVDMGETWQRLETGDRPYVRESCYHDQLYTAANRHAPLWTPPDAALLVERADGLEPVPYPGEPDSFIISWASTADRILAGTNDGRILRGRGDDWERLGTVPIPPDDQRAFGVISLTVRD